MFSLNGEGVLLFMPANQLHEQGSGNVRAVEIDPQEDSDH